MDKKLNFYNLTTVLLIIICIFFLSGCSSGNSSNTEVTNSIKNDDIKANTPSNNEEINDGIKDEVKYESLNLEMNDFEQSILDALEEGLYLVQTEQGFDYIKIDFNQDGFDDVVALITFDSDSDSYDFETKVMIMLFQTYDDEILLQTGGRSENLGGESIQYKDYKKLAWENGTLTYTHQSMRNEMNVDIKINDNFKGATVNKVAICYYDNTPSCEDLFIASGKDTLDLIDLDKEFLDSLISK